MARPTPELIGALRRTANKLESGAPYQWGHMGSCNCGNLAQELTEYTKAEIHHFAMRNHGDWTEQVNDYCATSGMPMDLLISDLLQHGLSIEDLKNLERLGDRAVLKRLPEEHRYPNHNKREDVVRYMKVWADLLEEEYLAKTKVPSQVMPLPIVEEKALVL
ncbi:MAG TPA: hypothetical protein DCE41_34710 [Cytophagales bacterium]|nr:hypothetical protein [Cytophagales bacterium]HAA17526.1 hypothetical protein [Cytophagales bacterium]HAP64169.1 hypothetical protein [Cytophagales bacterium]